MGRRSNKAYTLPASRADVNPFLRSSRQTLERSEEQSDEQSEILDALAQFCPTPLWIVHRDQIVIVNTAAVALLGAPDSRRLIGRTPGEFLRNREVSRCDGGSVPVSVQERSFEFLGEKAQIVSFLPLASHPDLDLYQQMAAPVCFTDTENRMVQWNRHFTDLSGSTKSLFSGIRFRDVCPELAAQLEPKLEAVLQTGRGLRGIQIRSTNPAASDHESDWLVALEPVRTLDGAVVGVNTSFQDITELKTDERQLRLIHRAIGESLDFGIWICDAEGRNTFSSESFCRLAGSTQDECAGFGWTQTMDPDRAALTLASWQECVASERNWTAEAWFKTGQESWQPVLMRGVPVRDASGKVLCWAGIILDIRTYKTAQEELEEANEKLERTNEELEEFAYAAGHDLQEPLRVIRMMTSLVKKRYAETLDQDSQTCLDTIEDSAARMANLVQDLLEYARVLQPLVANGDVSDLNAAVAIAIQSCQASINEHSAIVEADRLPNSAANFGQITRVFQNLISNAIKYRRAEAPRIRISADARGPEWRFCVADNGQGIDSDRQASIFISFKRLHNQEVPGSGLGLAVCRKIVEQHGGRIWVESQPGVGSMFFFTLPMD